MDVKDLMFRFSRMNPEEQSNLFFEVGKDKAGIGFKKKTDLINRLFGKGIKKAYGGIAGMLGEPTYADGGRIGFKGKKFDPKRRGFLKVAAGLASIPFIGKYFKWAKPLAKTSKVLTSAAEITQPSYLGSLIEVIKAKGIIKEVGKKGHKITEYKGVHLEEGPGIKTIYKKGKNKKIHQEVHEGEMHIKDEGLDTQKTIQADDEYYEATTKSGKTTERISKEDHKELSKIADEIRNMVPDADEWVQPIRFEKASGGRVPLGKGKLAKYATPEGLAKLMEKLFPGTTKLGKTSRPMAEKTQLKQAIAGFQKREAAKLKIWNDPDKVRAAVDDIFSSGDYKYDAEMAAEALVENNPAAFGGKLIDDLDDATRSEIYGAVLRVVQSDLGKMLQMKKLSKPTKTLEGIEKTGKINISDEGVADEFTRFMKEADPKGHKKLEQTVDLMNLDPKGKKGHASGGLAGMLGE